MAQYLADTSAWNRLRPVFERWSELTLRARSTDAMYDVWAMKRTNIYLDDEQLALLRGLGESRGEPVAALVREAVEAWLEAQGARRLPQDEWERRFSELLERRDRIAKERGFDEAEVERDVIDAVQEVRRARAASRR